jgi:hypothetical protein
MSFEEVYSKREECTLIGESKIGENKKKVSIWT